MRILVLSFLLLVVNLIDIKPQTPINTWRDHLCYTNVKKVRIIKNQIYCITEYGYFIYDPQKDRIEKFTTLNGLSDVSLSEIAYNESLDTYIFYYINGNLDLVKNGTRINIPDLKNKILTAEKGVNNIIFYGNYAYCSCDFGIMVVDMAKNEIKDTYVLGETGMTYSVYGTVIENGDIYAATSKGLFKASVNDPILVDFSRWEKQTNFPNFNNSIKDIDLFQNEKVMIVASNTTTDQVYVFENNNWQNKCTEINRNINDIAVYNQSITFSGSGHIYSYNSAYELKYDYSLFIPQNGITDSNGNIWVADLGNGIIKQPIDGSKFSYYYPAGPGSNSIWNMSVHFNNILVTGGAVDISWANTGLPGMVFRYKNGSWENLWNTNVQDYISIAGNPTNENDYFVGSWGYGLFEYNNSDLIVHYDQFNSSIKNIDWAGDNYKRIGGIAFDRDNNMWLSNPETETPISVRMGSDGSWQGLNYTDLSGSGTMGQVMCDSYGNVWCLLPRSKGFLFVIKPNGTPKNPDDDYTAKFSPKDAFKVQTSPLYCLAEDHDGTVWVGTNNGVVVYTDPNAVFNGETDGYQPLIPRLGTDNADPLLYGESVLCIAVDGANRKWFGTENGGAFLISADGTKQIKNFTVNNSPIISNYIRTIAIQPETGEVFFGTDKGIMSYRETATEGKENFENAYVYPNPVRPEYTGLITITGLMENSSVKITDISGNLVFQTTSLGGSATWDGKNKQGRRVATGVYLAFLTNEDGSETKVIKFLMVK